MCERVGKLRNGGQRGDGPDPKLVMPQKLDTSVYDISNDTSRRSRLYRSPPLWPVSSPTVPSILSRLWATDGASLGVNY